MPKTAKELTVLEIKNLPAGTYALGRVPGFYLRKRTKTTGFYFLRYSDATGRHDSVLGPYGPGGITLAAAKTRAFEEKEKIRQGISPIKERADAKKIALEKALEVQQKANPLTFEQVAVQWIDNRAQSDFWHFSKEGEKDTRQVLARHVFPFLGALDIEQITPEIVRDCLSRIWQGKPSTAKKVKSHINKIFQWAIAMHLRKNRTARILPPWTERLAS